MSFVTFSKRGKKKGGGSFFLFGEGERDKDIQGIPPFVAFLLRGGGVSGVVPFVAVFLQRRREVMVVYFTQRARKREERVL